MLTTGNDKIKIIQTSSTELELITCFEGTYASKKIDLGYKPLGIALYNISFLGYTNNAVYIYEINLETLELLSKSTLNISSNQFAINDDSIIVAMPKEIAIYSYEGEMKDSFPLSSNYGKIKLFNILGKYLLVCTSENYFSVYDISRRTLRRTVMWRQLARNGEKLGEIRKASINCKGNVIGFLINIIQNKTKLQETKFILFDVEMDAFAEYEISPNRIPKYFLWDYTDQRVFMVHTEYSKDALAQRQDEDSDDDDDDNNPLYPNRKTWTGPESYVMCYTSENGIHQVESHKLKDNIKNVFGLEMPDVFFISPTTVDPHTQSSLVEKKFQFFQGLNDINVDIKQSLCDFTLLIACGKLDEGYKIVKNIKNENIWENLAHICIKTKRLDVLEVCLSNMRFERGMKVFRENKHEKEPEVTLAQVAMHLGMIDEAKDLLQEVNRYDVLILFYIYIGEYDKAIETAKENDRINLHNTYYRIAQQYEKIDNIDNAVKYYKLSNCGDREIPRMLISKGKLNLLENNLNEKTPALLWWASYLESQGDYDKALSHYKQAQDTPNVVRLLLKEDKLEEAKKICDDTQNKDACYLLGRYYETKNNAKNAIAYYGSSGRINQAFKLAKENGLDNDIYTLGTKAPKNTQNLIAEYFEKKNDIEKAIYLYLLGSNIRKGLNLCLANNQYDKVREISESLQSSQDKETLKALADYFIQEQQQDKALGIYIRIKDYEKAMKLCENHNVKIENETAYTILDDLDKEQDNKTKLQLTSRLAKLLVMQGEFELAHNIYVRINNLKKAMKCYIKMGNKEKVIEFAHTCRKPELYVLAANFLQNLEWTRDLVRIIVTFFNKAKAYYNLANFYEVFASIEVNEKNNKDRAIELYEEAIKTVQKVRENDEKKDNKLTELRNKINELKGYNRNNSNTGQNVNGEEQ